MVTLYLLSFLLSARVLAADVSGISFNKCVLIHLLRLLHSILECESIGIYCGHKLRRTLLNATSYVYGQDLC